MATDPARAGVTWSGVKNGARRPAAVRRGHVADARRDTDADHPNRRESGPWRAHSSLRRFHRVSSQAGKSSEGGGACARRRVTRGPGVTARSRTRVLQPLRRRSASKSLAAGDERDPAAGGRGVSVDTNVVDRLQVTRPRRDPIPSLATSKTGMFRRVKPPGSRRSPGLSRTVIAVILGRRSELSVAEAFPGRLAPTGPIRVRAGEAVSTYIGSGARSSATKASR